MGTGHARILCVDDEENVLNGLKRTLHRLFNTHLAVGPEQGLKLIGEAEPFPVVLSDLRMPGMNGLEFIAQVRERCPDTVCLLLTGDADLASAISAVNDGHIFRFLTKPCPGPILIKSLKAAEHQYHLITSERILLEKTLRGSVAAMVEILAISNPAAFGKAQRLKRSVAQAYVTLGRSCPWQVEVAAMLSQVGWVALPEDTLHKLADGTELQEAEQRMMQHVPQSAIRVAASVPRLEEVAHILSQVGPFLLPEGCQPRRPCDSLESSILAAALDLDSLLSAGVPGSQAAHRLRLTPAHSPEAVDAVHQGLAQAPQAPEGQRVSLEELEVGATFLEDVKGKEGILLVSRGQIATAELIWRLQHVALRQEVPKQVLCAPPPAYASQLEPAD